LIFAPLLYEDKSGMKRGYLKRSLFLNCHVMGYKQKNKFLPDNGIYFLKVTVLIK